MGGGDAMISIQEVRGETDRGRKEEGGETVKAAGLGGVASVAGGCESSRVGRIERRASCEAWRGSSVVPGFPCSEFVA